MTLKLRATLACTVVVAIAAGAGHTGRAAADTPPPGEAACLALATAVFGAVTALATAYEAGKATQPPY